MISKTKSFAVEHLMSRNRRVGADAPELILLALRRIAEMHCMGGQPIALTESDEEEILQPKAQRVAWAKRDDSTSRVRKSG